MSLKKDVVFLPGFGFKSSIAQLVFASIESITVQPFDLPYDIADLTGMMRWLRLRVGQPIIWVGWSLGGLMALAFCHRYPFLCRKLIMICSTPKFMADNHWPGISHQRLQKFEKNLLQNAQRSMRNFVYEILLPYANHKLVRQLSTYLNESDLAANHHALTILQNSDLRTVLFNFDRPIHFLLAEDDALLSSKLAYHVSQINLQAKITCLSGMGHAPFMTHPQAFASILSECLEL